MAKQVSFFDGAQSSTTPTIGNVDTTNLACYANDAAYEAANAGAPTEGNIYCNTTDNTIHYYNGTAWTELADDDTAQTFTNKTLDGTSATGTNTITIDADDASYDNTTSGLTATNAQSAIDEVEGRLDTAETDITTAQGSADANTADIADIRTTQGTADGATDMGTFTGTTLSDNLSVKALFQEVETALENVAGPLVLQGNWNATTNSPALVSSTGTEGHFYIVNVAGTTTLDGESDWQIGDWVVFGNGVWFKQDNSQTVDSVNGQTGAVSLDLDDIADVQATGPSGRDQLRRDSGNTVWQAFDPNNTSSSSASGANAALAGFDAKVVNLTNAALESVDTIGAGYTNQLFYLVNKTTVPIIINNETGGATTGRILTGTSGPIDLDIDASLTMIYDSIASRWRIVGGTGAGGSGTQGIITGNNSLANSTAGDWAAYADAAGTFPVDGTGGSPNITISRTTSSLEIQEGKGSFIVAKGAFDRQGEGVSVDIECPRYIRGQASQISFSYQTTANFDHGSAADPVGSPSDISVFLYDVTNSKILNTNQPGIFGGGLYKANVQIPSDCADVRVILHIATTNALAWDFIFDRVQLDVAPNEFLRNRSDAINYTPAIVGLGTVTNLDTTYALDGDYLEIQGYCTVGTRTATELQVPLPDGYIISDDSPSPIGHVGMATWSGSAGVTYYVLATPGDAFLNMSFQTSSGHVPKLGNAIFTDGSNITWQARVKVQGLTSGVSHPASIGLNAQAVFIGTQSSEAVTANVTDITFTASKDTVGAWSTNQYTVKSPGDYQLILNLRAAVVSDYDVYINGTQFQTIGANAGSSFPETGGTVLEDLKYGDTISVRVANTTTVTDGRLSIHKIGSESQPYAPRIAYLKDEKASGTAGGTFTSGAFQTRDLQTLSGDTSFISNSTNQFTLQPGTYHIEWSAPALQTDTHQTKLRDITNTADALIGTPEESSSAGGVQNRSFGEGTISISSATTYEIQHRCDTTSNTLGYGNGAAFGIVQTYTMVKITKVL